MTEEQLKKYNAERKAIIKEYNGRALKQAAMILLIGAVVLAAVALICTYLFNNGPLGLVLCLIWGLFIVIMVWMKVLMVKNAKEKKLHEFEDQSLLRTF